MHLPALSQSQKDNEAKQKKDFQTPYQQKAKGRKLQSF